MGNVPASIRVLCILGIIFSGAVILLNPCSIVLMFHPLTPNPMADALNKDAGYVAFALVSGTVNFLFAVLLLAASIGSLKLRPWGRKAMLTYAWSRIGEMVIVSTINVIFILPKLEGAMAATPAMAAGPMGGMIRVVTIIGLVIGILISLAISGVLIYFFNRKIARDAFNGIFVPGPGSFPVQYNPYDGSQNPPQNP